MASIGIVDDSLILRKTLKKILEESGYNIVFEASDGQEGIKAYLKFKPDVVTLDYNMPKFNGVQVAQAILKQDKKAKIVLVTSYTEKEKVMEAIQTGIKYYIVKPLSYDKVKKTINKVLNSF